MNVKVECKEVESIDNDVHDEVVDRRLIFDVVDDACEVGINVTVKVVVVVNVNVEVDVVGVLNVYADVTLQDVVDDNVESDVNNEVDNDVVRDDDNEVGNDGDVDEAPDYVGHAVGDLDKVEEVLEDVVVDVSVANDVLKDIVEVDVVDVLDDVLVVMNPTNVAVDVVEYDDDAYDDDGFTVEVVDELRIDNDDNENDVGFVADVVGEVAPVVKVVDAVKAIVVQAIGDDNGNDDVEGCALMHAKEKAS